MKLGRTAIRFCANPVMFAAILLGTTPFATSQTEKVLYSFNNTVAGTDGIRPQGGVIFDSVGNLYGTTAFGGSGACVLDSTVPGCGTVYELVQQSDGTWAETVLHNFALTGGGPQEPSGSNLVSAGSLIFDNAGNLYGFTQFGGVSQDCPHASNAVTSGCGTAYELIHKSTGWTSRVLHSFDGTNKDVDGHFPGGTPVFDAAGNIYGATGAGGNPGNLTEPGGMAFELRPETPPATWFERTVYNFNVNGIDPAGGLIFDAAGNLYGLAAGGGQFAAGVAYELTRTPNGGWTEKVLHSFGHGTDASQPFGSLVMDRAGNLYGVSTGGGPFLFGTVFELSPAADGNWTEKVLHNFDNKGGDGGGANSPLILDASGNLYGTTLGGGATGNGTVYKMAPNGDGTWTETILYSFQSNGVDGINPSSSLIFDSSGNLYGVTQFGGTFGNGTVFELTP
jgi:uncharacterized repeat protein (TIGR03803 family)